MQKKNIHSLPPPERKETNKKEFTKREDNQGLIIGDEGMFQIRVTEIRKPDHIFLQTQDSSQHLADLEKKLAEMKLGETKAPEGFKPKERDLVFCQFSHDQNWYRAKITKIEKASYSVFYVDFGNQEVVKFGSLRPITDEKISKLPNQAKEAFLAFVEPKRTSHTEEAIQYVSDFCLDKDLLARHEYKIGNRIYISIFDEKGKFGLNADLIRNGLVFISKNPELYTGLSAEKFKKPLAELEKNLVDAKKEKNGFMAIRRCL